MDSGYYALSTALIARTQALDTIANNLANASTNGYRAARDVFSSVLAASGSAQESGLTKRSTIMGFLEERHWILVKGLYRKPVMIWTSRFKVPATL